MIIGCKGFSEKVRIILNENMLFSWLFFHAMPFFRWGLLDYIGKKDNG